MKSCPRSALQQRLTGQLWQNISSAENTAEGVQQQQLAFKRLGRLLAPTVHLDPLLLPAYNELAAVWNQLAMLQRRAYFSSAQVVELKQRLKAVEDTYVRDAKFVVPNSPTGGDIKGGQAVLMSLLSHCYAFSHHLLVMADKDGLDDQFSGVYDQLLGIHALLSSMQSGKDKPDIDRLTLVQKQLNLIESQYRKDGKFTIASLPKGQVPSGQAELVQLLESCHDLVYDLLCSLDTASTTTQQQPTQQLTSTLRDLSTRASQWSQAEYNLAQKYLQSL